MQIGQNEVDGLIAQRFVQQGLGPKEGFATIHHQHLEEKIALAQTSIKMLAMDGQVFNPQFSIVKLTNIIIVKGPNDQKQDPTFMPTLVAGGTVTKTSVCYMNLYYLQLNQCFNI